MVECRLGTRAARHPPTTAPTPGVERAAGRRLFSARVTEHAMHDADRYPPQFPPPWASAWGDDEHGLWAEFAIVVDTIKTASAMTWAAEGKWPHDNLLTQRLRWIEPGTFLMGSPKEEARRFDDEHPQHAVTISRGVWIAESACTQALWVAMIGVNPSKYRGSPDLPVEQVSWREVQDFLNKLEAQLSGCVADLPTEAEWEYACRAGTTTPFSFGEQITSAQANYNGNYPYKDGDKGENRDQTIPVKSLPANPWGLYEIHGNVWEWCRDGERQYRSQPERDPVGDETPEARRAVRGSSWFNDAGVSRSAYRLMFHPSYSAQNLGFRLCLRPIEPGQVQPGVRQPGKPDLRRRETD